jgi:hypothetical protein
MGTTGIFHLYGSLMDMDMDIDGYLMTRVGFSVPKRFKIDSY